MARSLLGWRVWYDENRTFNSRTSRWSALPADGIQCVMVYYENPTGSMMIAGNDFYFYAQTVEGDVFGGGSDAADIASSYPGADIKKGRWTSLNALDQKYDEAMNERSAP